MQPTSLGTQTPLRTSLLPTPKAVGLMSPGGGTLLQAPPWVCPSKQRTLRVLAPRKARLVMRTFTEIATQLTLARVTRNSRFFCHGDLVEGLLFPILGSPFKAGWGGGHCVLCTRGTVHGVPRAIGTVPTLTYRHPVVPATPSAAHRRPHLPCSSLLHPSGPVYLGGSWRPQNCLHAVTLLSTSWKAVHRPGVAPGAHRWVFLTYPLAALTLPRGCRQVCVAPACAAGMEGSGRPQGQSSRKPPHGGRGVTVSAGNLQGGPCRPQRLPCKGQSLEGLRMKQAGCGLLCVYLLHEDPFRSEFTRTLPY